MSTLRTDYLESLDTGRSIEVDNIADLATTYTETEVDNLLDDKADQATTYTETEVDGLLDAKADQDDVDLLAPVDAPVFTGVPEADTAALGTSTKQIATTEFVSQALAGIPITGTATFTNSTNNIALTGIGSIGLEVGDVIQVTGTASNNKLFTVEVITDSGNVIVNSAHAGGTTSKSLVNETVSATVTLLSKWVNAPVGLGEGWVSLMAGRAKDIIYTNNTGRSLSVMVSVADVTNDDANITAYVDDLQLSVSEDNPYSDSASASRATVSFLVPNESTYEINFLTDSDTLNTWVELR